MGQIVSVFMIGLLPFTLFYVLMRGFYALEDTRTPFLVTVAFSAAWLAMAVPAFRLVGPGGPQVASIALAYGLSYWLGCVATWILLARRLGSLDSGRTVRAILLMLAAGLISLVVMLTGQAVIGRVLPPSFIDDRLGVLTTVGLVSVLGVVAYLACSRLLRIAEVNEVMSLVRHRSRRLLGSRP
jgi:putative peptidoglycan lipid II flippase